MNQRAVNLLLGMAVIVMWVAAILFYLTDKNISDFSSNTTQTYQSIVGKLDQVDSLITKKKQEVKSEKSNKK